MDNQHKKKTRKTWTLSTIKWVSLYSIGCIVGMWSIVLEWDKMSLTRLSFVLILPVAISLSVLLMEITTTVNKSKDRYSRIRVYVNAIIFIGLAILSSFVGWYGGIAARNIFQ